MKKLILFIIVMVSSIHLSLGHDLIPLEDIKVNNAKKIDNSAKNRNISFAKPSSCPSPFDIMLDSVSTETAILSWMAGNTETQWNIEWKAGDGTFSPGTG
ncbi:MAG: hypothetical protein ACPGXZ_05830, partial [Saprospiraceae bacterium]